MDAQGLTSPQRKLVMWYKVKELKSKGLSPVKREGLNEEISEKMYKIRELILPNQNINVFLQPKCVVRN